jgi:large subunit ribosomal protein L21
MYAIIEQGGKQFKVSQGDVINIELTEVAPDAKTIELNKVLFVSDGDQVKIGTPYLEGAKGYCNLQGFCGRCRRLKAPRLSQ